MLPFKLSHEVTDHSIIKIFATQMSVTCSRLDLKDAIFNGENGDIKGAATQIKDENVLLLAFILLLVQAISDGSGCRLIDDSENIETCDDASILGGLSLGVIEVGGDSDDGIIDIMTKVGLSSFLHLEENHGRDLLGCEGLLLILVLHLDLGLGVCLYDSEGPMLHVGSDCRVGKLAADQPLGIKDGIVGVHRDLVLGGIADEPLGVREGHIRGRGPGKEDILWNEAHKCIYSCPSYPDISQSSGVE